ncbi:MAG TPA: alkaline phosphatase family protein [Anaeromyxobacteraceae bacterium]|nr:alkaline phosphatase family protein [Anaeromyxobacteraceae bacterium]
MFNVCPVRFLAFLNVFALAACGSPRFRDHSADPCPNAVPALAADAATHHLKTIFVILMENRDWSSIKGSPSAPYINGTLLPKFAHAENYRNGGLHPSLGNYILLEAGDKLGITFDASPADVHLDVPCHLATYLEAIGISWKAYEEGIGATTCPVADALRYVVRHDPFVYFHDIAGNPPNTASPRCIAHVRPYTEFSRDLQTGGLARYNFITPDLCDSGHDSCTPYRDQTRQSDAWLERELPNIMGSQAYRDGGVIFITWDEAAAGDHPIGLIAVSPFAKPGYAAPLPYSHASTLRTIEEVLGLTPLLRGAATAANLSDLFTNYP